MNACIMFGCTSWYVSDRVSNTFSQPVKGTALGHCGVNQGRQSWGLGVATPTDFRQGECRSVVKYYYSLSSCTGSMFESGDF